MRKNKLFNKNSTPFLLLAFVHIFLFFTFAKRSKEKNILILLLSNMGFAYLFEYLVLNLFKGYTYKPAILKSRFPDQVLGAILSQGFYVPITATLLTKYGKNLYWKLGSTLIYYLIEKYFVYLKIYKDYWWQPIYTVFFMNIYFYLSDWFNKALNAKKNWALVIAEYLSTEVIGVTFLYVIAVRRKVRFGLGAYHSWREHFIIAPLYSLIRVLFLVKNSSKPGLLPKLRMLIGSICLDMLLERTGLLKLRLNKLWNICFHAMMIYISRYLYLKVHQKQQ